MSKPAAAPDWREARRRSARDALVAAAWEIAREDGLAALSLRRLAQRAGTTTPTVYAYFESKNAIVDAMFEQAATDFAELMDRPYPDEADPRQVLLAGVHRFIDFCTSDIARYQLLFQHAVPGFAPSERAYAPAVRALEVLRARLRRVGITRSRHFDLWTAITTGLVDQQISNDPHGRRWSRLASEAVQMFLDHCTKGTDAP